MADTGETPKVSKKLADESELLQVSLTDDKDDILGNVKLLPIKRSNEDISSEHESHHDKLSANDETNKKLKTIDHNVDPNFITFKNRLLRHVNQTLPADETRVFSYLNETRQEVSRILKQSIIQKESHSVIMVGPRNSYKSFLINNELNLISKQHGNQFITVRLNGFIHSEQAAINGIASQLETQLQKIHEGNESKQKTKHLEENETDVSSGSLTEVFEKILKLLDSTRTHPSKSSEASTKVTVIFIFDEIDTFAGPVRQTLLYNLFDMVEHAMVPVCIFGNTTKLNILEFLEKRVKSRFSQRMIYMPDVRDFDEFLDTVDELLSPFPVEYESTNTYMNQWNKYVTDLIKKEDYNLFTEIKRNYETFGSITVLKNIFIPLIAGATSFDELVTEMKSSKYLREYSLNQLQNSLTSTVKSLSDLELAILISAARTAIKSKDETINFNLTYVEYKDMIKSLNARIPSTTNLNAGSIKLVDNIVKLWSKEDMKNVWETLQTLNFISERSAIGLRESAMAVFYASNYQFQGSTIPFDLRIYQVQVTLQELRRIVSKSSMYYPWTQL